MGLRIALWLSVGMMPCPVHAADRCDELWAAANIDDVKRIAEIVNGGTSVNCRDSQTAQTALMAAAMSGHVDAVKLLLALGASPNTKDAQGKTALGMVRDREKAFSKLPNFAELVERQRQVIAILEPRTEGGAASQADAAPLEAKPADPDMIAPAKFQSARAAMMTGNYADAEKYLREAYFLEGISERNRAKLWAMTADLNMRRKQWNWAKEAAEKAVNSSGADEEDRDFCKQVLKDLRKYHSELFQ